MEAIWIKLSDKHIFDVTSLTIRPTDPREAPPVELTAAWEKHRHRIRLANACASYVAWQNVTLNNRFFYGDR